MEGDWLKKGVETELMEGKHNCGFQSRGQTSGSVTQKGSLGSKFKCIINHLGYRRLCLHLGELVLQGDKGLLLWHMPDQLVCRAGKNGFLLVPCTSRVCVLEHGYD